MRIFPPEPRSAKTGTIGAPLASANLIGPLGSIRCACRNGSLHPFCPGMTRSADEPAPAVPWHLKLLGAALAIYLGYRFLQLIDWAFHH